MKILFFSSLGFLLYIYFIYPVTVILLSQFRESPDYDTLQDNPRVSVLVAARDEEGQIEEKIGNFNRLDYPNLEVLIGSDGSTDSTVEIASEMTLGDKKFRVFEFDKMGKGNILNELHRKASGEILVFTDADILLEPDAITNLVAPFGDPDVGCVIGNLRLSGLSIEKIYWNYRKTIRKAEQKLFGTTVGVSGALWAIREELFTPFPEKQLADDLWLPLRIGKLGYRTAYQESAVARGDTGTSLKNEISRRIRIVHNNVQVMKRYLPPLDWFGFQYMSRKLLWHLMPLGYLGLLFSNIFLLQTPLFSWIFALQLIFYATGLGAIYWNLSKPWSLAGFAVGMQWALIKGTVAGLVNRPVEWEVVR